MKIEEPLSTTYKGIEVYKLAQWQQGPVLLQALNILENVDVKALGYNTPRYLHTLYQTMNLAFADRDFYYGDPAFPPDEPMRGLLSKDYARTRAKLINPDRERSRRSSPAIRIRSRAARIRSSSTSKSWPPPDKPVRIKIRPTGRMATSHAGKKRSTPAPRRFRRRTK